MAVTQEQIDKLEAALARGVLEVDSDGERIRYASPKEMRETIDYLRARQAAEQGRAQPMTLIATSYDRDW